LTALKRTLSLPLVVFYGLGTILGAGIYVLVGAVVAEAGAKAPLAFVVAAVIAAFTAFSYAELVGRFPRAAGEAAYVDAAFGQAWLTRLVGIGVVMIGVVSAATIANGFASYLAVFVEVPAFAAVGAVVVTIGVVAAVGIETSVWAAAACTIVELAGLAFVVAIAGGGIFSGAALTALVPPSDPAGLTGIGAGAFLAFYAFIGFEDMVNIVEETRAPERNVARAIVIALVVSTLVYVLVALTVVTAVPLAEVAKSEAPLAVVVEGAGADPRIIAGVSLVAVVNGALVQVVMASRVLYGLGNGALVPAALARVHPVTRTPLVATGVVTALVAGFALSLPLVELAAITSIVTLGVFTAVNAALVTVQAREGLAGAVFRVPRVVPLVGAGLSIALVIVEFVAR